MRVHGIELGEDGLPTEARVTLSIAEIALIAHHVGDLAPTTRTSEELWDVLTGDIINRFWDGGITELPRGPA